MAVHSFQKLIAGGVDWQVELSIESVKLENIMMKRTRASARTEIARNLVAAIRGDSGPFRVPSGRSLVPIFSGNPLAVPGILKALQ